MIKEKMVLIKGHPRNLKYYKNIGYDIKVGEEIEVFVKDLIHGSPIKITTICINCYNESINTFKDYWNYTNGLIDPYYCIKCKSIKSEKTCLDKYGVSNPMKSEFIKSKLKQSNLNKYGVDSPFKSEIVKDKIKKTNLEKWGVENVFSNNDIKDKIKKTNKDNLGVFYPMQSEIVLNKSRSTNNERYGKTSYSKTDEYKEKVKNTSLEKWGVENYSKTDEYKEKVKNTSLEKWGVENYSKTDKFKRDLKNKRQRKTFKKFIKLLNNEYDVLKYSDDIFHINHNRCGLEFEINKSLLSKRIELNNIICTNCNSVGVQKSSIEREILFFLDDNNIDYISGDRNVLNGKELDIFIPSHNIAIEINGLYWHSELYKGQKYHLNKTNECNKIGIHLIHIWEDDWKNRKETIKSIIINKLGIIKNKIWARKCQIGEVSSKDARLFLDDNHIQGFSSSSLKIGLYFNKKLVSLMTFGFRYTNGKREYELIRFCNLIGYNIVGGSSKIFKYFLNNNNVNEIISYSDISMFDGSMYDMLGFKKVSRSKPNYWWVIDGKRSHRYNWSKKKLVEKGHDPNLSEVEIMNNLGYFRIFGCGQEKWVYKNE